MHILGKFIMLYDFLQDSKGKCLKLQTFLKRHLLYVGYLRNTLFLEFYFRVKKANKVSVKKVEEKVLSRLVTHLIFITKAHNFFVTLISNNHLSHKC